MEQLERRRTAGRPTHVALLASVTAQGFIAAYLFVYLWQPFARIRATPDVVQFRLLPLLGVIALLLALLLAGPDRLRRIRVPWALVAYLGWAALSITWTSQWDNGLVVIKGELLSLTLVWLVASTIPVPALLRTIMLSFVTIATVSLVYVVISPRARSQVIGDQSEILQLGWLAGFYSKNFLGMFAVLGVVMVLAVITDRRLQAALGGLFVLLLFGSRSATAAVALIVTLATWSALTWGRALVDRIRSHGSGAAIGAAVGTIILAALALPAVMLAYGKDSTLSKRTEIWSESWRVITEAPLVGHGIGAVWFNADDPITRRLDDAIGFTSYHAHNGVLDVWLSLGVVGVVLMLAFVVHTGILANRARRIGGPSGVVGRWALTMLAAVATMAIVEPLLRQGTLGLLIMVWVIVAKVTDDEPHGRGRESPADLHTSATS